MPKYSEPVERAAFSIREVAQSTGLSRATIYRLVAAGKLRTRKVGSRTIVPRAERDALANEGAK